MIRKEGFFDSDLKMKDKKESRGWKLLLNLHKRIFSLLRDRESKQVKKAFKPYIETWRKPS